ncbi:riboflavin synthase [Niallia sp. Sow4_A1]|uniref:Riboflavin synthase n=1 Tax=Niallia hominis TaxID=3133173 RepID=A0ABV1EZJ0_9BACI|nr:MULTISPECIES: riboflavin synthase [Bacillaceae]MCF2650659.1 riboflavin synthase [Niallia circulans]MCM3364652.1 riboflavin synthase [Niallia sp. MER TA 168]CAI9396139.1 Riboflavin synthase [Bacillus sp. T2.9-1]
MFTGLVEELGVVKHSKKTGHTISIVIQAEQIMEDMKIGDSIAVNGVCLTVTSFDYNLFTVDVMPNTYNDTTLRLLSSGTGVNLERAMAADGRFGGHFVSGHVDCTGTIISTQKVENSTLVEIQIPENQVHLTMDKGSITVDGTSLTIFKTTPTSIFVSLIPHTSKVSMIGNRRKGELVNIEFDLLAKYFYSFMNRDKDPVVKKESNLTASFLRENGF